MDRILREYLKCWRIKAEIISLSRFYSETKLQRVKNKRTPVNLLDPNENTDESH